MKQKACQTDNCYNPGTITVILSCHTPHLTETRCCREHLAELSELSRQQKLFCHCRLPIITGMYRDNQKILKLGEQK